MRSLFIMDARGSSKNVATGPVQEDECPIQPPQFEHADNKEPLDLTKMHVATVHPGQSASDCTCCSYVPRILPLCASPFRHASRPSAGYSNHTGKSLSAAERSEHNRAPVSSSSENRSGQNRTMQVCTSYRSGGESEDLCRSSTALNHFHPADWYKSVPSTNTRVSLLYRAPNAHTSKTVQPNPASRRCKLSAIPARKVGSCRTGNTSFAFRKYASTREGMRSDGGMSCGAMGSSAEATSSHCGKCQHLI